MEYIQEITLDLNTNTAYTTIGAKQSDNGSRVVKVYLTENGEDYNLNDPNHTVTSAYYRLHKPDGKAVINTVDIDESGEFLTLVFTAQGLAVPGRAYCDIVLQNGAQILSTVSFILVIMAAPAVADQGISGNEFGFLTAVVNDATVTVQDSEAWATGERGGQPVVSTQSITASADSVVISGVSVNENVLFEQIGHVFSATRNLAFTYQENETWKLILTTTNGTKVTTDDPKVITSIGSYGIELTYVQGSPLVPNPNDVVTVIVAEPDPAANNNAKYYAVAASSALAEASALLASTVKTTEQTLTSEEQAQARQNINAQAAGDYIENPVEKIEGQYLTYSSDGWAASTLPDFVLNPADKTIGQYLTYSSDGWAASTLPNYILDPAIKQNGQVLAYGNDGWYAANYIAEPTQKTSGSILQYNGSNWAAASISALDLQGIPSILTSAFYGDNMPDNPVPGQLFFLKTQ